MHRRRWPVAETSAAENGNDVTWTNFSRAFQQRADVALSVVSG